MKLNKTLMQNTVSSPLQQKQRYKITRQSQGATVDNMGGWMHVLLFRENSAYLHIFQNHKAMQSSTAGALLSWELEWTICSRGWMSREPSFPGPVVSSAERSLACRLFLSYTTVPTVPSSSVSTRQKWLIFW